MNCDAAIQLDATTRQCVRCGHRFENVPPGRRIVRRCDSLDLNAKPKRPHLRIGDAVAKVAAAIGIKKKDGCGCGGRQRKLNHLVPNPFYAPPAAELLLEFHHGFGDAVQFTVVLAHLKKHFPDWVVDVLCKVGSHTLFGGLVRNVFMNNTRAKSGRTYTHRRWLRWPEVFESYPDSPATKAEFCLRHVFGIEPEPALCRYHVQYGNSEAELAQEYLERNCAAARIDRPAVSQNGGAPRFPVVMFHYQGNTARRRKNVGEQIIKRCADVTRERGFVPVILDWSTPHRSKLIDQETAFCPDINEPLWRGTGTGDGAGLAALIDHATLFVGIDSGPQKVAGATSTPTIGVWTHHHPLHFYGLSPNVTHVVPKNHHRYIHGDVDVGLKYFTENYRHRVQQRHLRYELPELIEEKLGEVASC